MMYRDLLSKVERKWAKEVQRELRAIKKYATPEQLARLRITQIEGNVSTQCIYGQLTGNCESKAARELFEKVNVIAVYRSRDGLKMYPEGDRKLKGFTPLEWAIMSHTECGKQAARFLKGTGRIPTYGLIVKGLRRALGMTICDNCGRSRRENESDGEQEWKQCFMCGRDICPECEDKECDANDGASHDV